MKKITLILLFLCGIFLYILGSLNNSVNDSNSTSTSPNIELGTFEIIGDGFSKDKNYIYEGEKIVFDLKKGKNPFDEAAKIMQEISHNSPDVIETIIETYYTLTLPEDLGNQNDIFVLAGMIKEEFFMRYQKGLINLNENSLDEYPAFREAFVIKNSPAYSNDFPYPTGHINEDVFIVGRKFLANDVMDVYYAQTVHAYGGPAANLCKEGGINIDKFTFKKVDNEWKIYDINQFIDHWTTNNEGSTEEECKEINQDKINKYKI